MAKREKWLTAVGIVAAIVCTVYTIGNVKEFVSFAKRHNTTIEELVERYQATLPISEDFKNGVSTLIGIEIRKDSLVYINRIDACDSILTIVRKSNLAAVLRPLALQTIVSEYKTTLLTKKVCDAQMVISYLSFDPFGNLMASVCLTPDDYLPLLTK